MKRSNILYFYTPESRARMKARLAFSKRPRNLWQERQLYRIRYKESIQSMLFWFMLLFAFRVGTVIFMSLAGNKDLPGIPVLLPNARATAWFVIKENSAEIWVNEEQMIALGDRIVNLESLNDILEKLHGDTSSKQIILHIDRRCKMDVVSRIVNLANEHGFQEFVFATHRGS